MELNEIYETKILRLNNEGEGIAQISGLIVFIKNALQDEVVKIKIKEIKKNYVKGEVIEIIKKSSKRVEPICPYFSMCGGCNLMHMSKCEQLKFKKEKINNIFKKICNLDIKLDKVNNYNYINYRNKVVFKVKEDKIGFYKNKSNEIIDIKECIISDSKINDCLKLIRKFILNNKDNDINEIMIRVCNCEVMLVVDNLKKDLIQKFIDIFDKKIVKSIYINNNLVYGKSYLIQTINNLDFKVSAKSFFQVNILTASKLYDEVIKNIKSENTIVDLYSGTGTITMLLSKKSKKVIGIEVLKDAVKDAKNNMVLNNIDNITFKCGKVEKVIDEIKELDIDVLVMDPPRSGSDKKTLNDIIKLSPKKIIYISCNPVTLARDYNVIREFYKIKEISAFDMFVNTNHVECVALLSLKTTEKQGENSN